MRSDHGVGSIAARAQAITLCPGERVQRETAPRGHFRRVATFASTLDPDVIESGTSSFDSYGDRFPDLPFVTAACCSPGCSANPPPGFSLDLATKRSSEIAATRTFLSCRRSAVIHREEHLVIEILTRRIPIRAASMHPRTSATVALYASL